MVWKGFPAFPAMSLGQEDPLEEGVAAHSSILAWKIPWTEEPGRLQSMGLQRQIRLKRLSSSSTIAAVSSVLARDSLKAEFSSPWGGWSWGSSDSL